MIPFEQIRTAVNSDVPWTRLDEIVRAELLSGRTTKQIYDEMLGMSSLVHSIPDLSADGEDAFGDTLDALNGFCKSEHEYRNLPTRPSEAELASLPHWAAVAIAARCARRVLPLFKFSWPDSRDDQFGTVENDIEVAEIAAANARESSRRNDSDSVVTALQANAHARRTAQIVARAAARAAEASAACQTLQYFDTGVHEAIDSSIEAAESIGVLIQPHIRRDYDHIAHLAHWHEWTDDTPVPPEYFGPLWPEGLPAGWPSDIEMPVRTDQSHMFFSAVRLKEVPTTPTS